MRAKDASAMPTPDFDTLLAQELDRLTHFEHAVTSFTLDFLRRVPEAVPRVVARDAALTKAAEFETRRLLCYLFTSAARRTLDSKRREREAIELLQSLMFGDADSLSPGRDISDYDQTGPEAFLKSLWARCGVTAPPDVHTECFLKLAEMLPNLFSQIHASAALLAAHPGFTKPA
jgi:hypothetical protein